MLRQSSSARPGTRADVVGVLKPNAAKGSAGRAGVVSALSVVIPSWSRSESRSCWLMTSPSTYARASNAPVVLMTIGSCIVITAEPELDMTVAVRKALRLRSRNSSTGASLLDSSAHSPTAGSLAGMVYAAVASVSSVLCVAVLKPVSPVDPVTVHVSAERIGWFLLGSCPMSWVIPHPWRI